MALQDLVPFNLCSLGSHQVSLKSFAWSLPLCLCFFLFKIYFIFWPLCTACGVLVPQPEVEPMPPALNREVLTTGRPEESQCLCFDLIFNLKWSPGDFLADQWLRTHASNAVGVVLIRSLGTKVPHEHGVAPPKKLEYSPGCPATVPKPPSPFSEPPFPFECTSLSFYGGFHPWIIIDSMLATSLGL